MNNLLVSPFFGIPNMSFLRSRKGKLLLGAIGAFITYSSMYAFRKPFTAGVYDGLSLWGLDYKVVIIIAQVLGYTLSKFWGIKQISELKPSQRVGLIVLLISISWLGLWLFALIPYPYNWWCLFINGLPLGMIWGIVFAYLEGRRQTELLAAILASSFIVSSGLVKSVGRSLVLGGISEFWMPALTGALFIPSLALGIWLLNRIPLPDEADLKSRTERLPMQGGDRMRFLKSFFPGIVIVTLIYMSLNAYRDFRDNFAVEIWNALGYASQPEIMTFSEIPIALFVLVLSGTMILLKDNRWGFYINFLMILLGGILTLGTTVLFSQGKLSPSLWMIAVGLGMYIPYMFYHTMFFERWIAHYQYTSNIGFLMYICDSFGYLASVGVMLYKDFWVKELSWLAFFQSLSMGMGVVIIILGAAGVSYFLWLDSRRARLARVSQLP